MAPSRAARAEPSSTVILNDAPNHLNLPGQLSDLAVDMQAGVSAEDF
ncbi:hypothetical protein ABIF38_000382 [Bradyrhizobium japonicum]|nr:hypothetical protein [Bradyrhizobium elkanii]MCP1737553.1 hypothetical protein [Bradyrhizobium elkanii]MCS3576110.1 hypothetical protein [Bradyrhizobium elkanii]MCS3594555.1 hypothetical protein [Bradyrhizobium elkanii]MCS3626144.1 hypothetical protein [Bradyrhizobium elkanii]